MSSFPHKPDMESMRATAKLVEAYLVSDDSDPDEVGVRCRRAGQLVLRACLDHCEAAAATQVAASLGKALTEYARAAEMGWRMGPWHMWNITCTALAVRNFSMAHFLAAAPEIQWREDWRTVLHSLGMAILALHAILRSDRAEAERWIAALRVLAFEDPPTDGMKLNLDEIRNFHQLLEALHKKDPLAFNAALQIRTEVHAASFARNGRNSPLGFLDLHGLGLCALARDFGMTITVRHAYLPLELLDAAAELPRNEPPERK